MNLKRWALALLSVAAILAVWWVSLEPKPTPPAPAAERAAPTLGDPAGTDTPSRAAASLPPLPLTGVPLREAFPSLRARAESGDARAACRLALELLRCREVARESSDEMKQVEATLADPEANVDPALRVQMARQVAMLQGLQRSCAGLPEEASGEAARFLRQAALADEPAALYLYAAGEGFDQRAGFAFIGSPLFDQWRGEAAAMMDRALAAGDARAAHALQQAHLHDIGLFAGAVADDPLHAHAFGNLVSLLFGDTLSQMFGPQPVPPVPPETAAEAAGMASRWHHEFFGGRRMDFLDYAMDMALVPPDATAEEVLARDLCATGEERHGG